MTNRVQKNFIFIFLLMFALPTFANLSSLEEKAKEELKTYSTEISQEQNPSATKIATVTVSNPMSNQDLFAKNSFMLGFSRIAVEGKLLESEEVLADSTNLNRIHLKLSRKYNERLQYFGQFSYGILQTEAKSLAETEKLNLNLLGIALGFEHLFYTNKWLTSSYAFNLQALSVIQVSETGLYNQNKQINSAGAALSLRTARFFENSTSFYFSYLYQKMAKLDELTFSERNLEMGLEVIW